MKAIFLAFYLAFCALSLFDDSPAMASPSLDERYALRKTAAVVLDSQTATVYAEQLQSQLSSLVRGNSRFEWSDEAFLRAEDWLKRNPGAGGATFEKWQPLFAELARLGVQSLVIAQLKTDDAGYALSLRLVTTTAPQVMAQAQFPLGARPTIGNLNEGARQAWLEMLNGIPFDGSILRREGYRVILDRGRPTYREGMRLSAYTLETEDGVNSAPLQLIETGLIQITRVENDIAFGRIVVEWKPREVSGGNKIRWASSALAAEKGPLFPALDTPFLEAGRPSTAMASANTAIDGGGPISGPNNPIRAQQSKFGSVSVDLSGDSLAMNRTSATTGVLSSQSSFFPGATLLAEGYLTRTWFGSVSYGFGLGGWNDATLQRINGSYSQLRIQGGYRWNMLGSEQGPSLRGRFGYSATKFSVDPSTDLTAPTAAGYSGLLVGGDFIFPFAGRMGIGLEANALLLPSLSEDNGTSGAQTSSVSAWDFALRLYYQLDPVFRLDARFVFQAYAAEFTGVGTAPAVLSASSTGGRQLTVGLTYGF